MACQRPGYDAVFALGHPALFGAISYVQAALVVAMVLAATAMARAVGF